MVYNIQNQWISGLFHRPEFEIARKHNDSGN
jgi:hypothetical protein